MAHTIFRPDSAPIRGVLFDMDGVILDSEKLYTRFWAEACQSFGFPMTFQQALGLRSLNHEAAQTYLSSLFGPEIRYADVHKRRIELMSAYVDRHGVEAKPGVRQLLTYLREHNIPYALTTASPQDRIESHLGSLGLLELFEHICTAYQVPHGKPEPDIYLLGAKTIGLPPQNCLALEDSYTGMLAAHRAGCKATIVPDLDQPGEYILAIAYAKADSLLDVIDMIQ